MDVQVDSDAVGVALLVSNDYKILPKKYQLNFTHTDTDKLKQLFKNQFSYVVCRKKNVSTADFVSCYKRLSEFKYPPTCKRILVYFSGHGNDGTLLMQDGNQIQIEDVISCFKTNIANNSTLAEMAKMFFFDACRGTQEDFGLSLKHAETADEITCLRRIPKEGNVLVAYASTRYFVSYGDTAGSRWTGCLVRALSESKESDDVQSILTGANKMMKEEANDNCFQTAEFTSSLSDFIYFKQEAIKM